MNKLILAIFLIGSAIFPELVIAQKGIIRGSVYDQSTGEPLYGVSVLVKETQTGAVTDFDGDFEIQVDPGTYSLQISFISYNTMEVSDVKVESGKVTLFENLKLEEFTSELEAVVISAEAIRTTEAALMSVKRNAANLIDGISSAAFKQIGDGDAASAIKRVTGVSIEGGKYIYIRGLGDRYTKTILNGVDIPGLDPDRNSIQMDIFPTNVIDNIIVSKSFTSDLSADFTGGVVDIETKDFPEEKTFKLSLSGGYNPAMHFNNNYLSTEGSSTDILGFDNGKRSIPTGGRTNIPQFADVIGNPNSEKGQDFQRVLRGFDPILAGTRKMSPMDYGLSVSFGNQLGLGNKKFGYNFALTYKNETEFYEDAQYSLYAKPRFQNEFELEPLEIQKGDYGVNNVLLGGLAGIAYKSDKTKIKLNLMHLQNGESKVGTFDFVNTNLGAVFEADQYNVEYSQRALTNLMLSGDHYINDRKWEINWKVSPTRSRIEDPDLRITRFRKPNNTISTEVGLPARIWRNLEEENIAGKLNLTRNYLFNGNQAKLRFGSSYTVKDRDFNIQSFQFPTGNTNFSGDPNQILIEENLFSANNRNGVRYDPMFIPNNPNQYNSTNNNLGVYIHNEFVPFKNMKAIVGLRMEQFQQFYTGTNQNRTIVFNNEKVLEDFDLFPTINLIQTINANQNIRLAFSRTIARPSFKELSFAEILDPINGRTFIGGLFQETTNGGTEVLWDGNLESTRINNFDLRWEVFQQRGQMFSVSGFYKTFDKPIEIVQFLSDPGAFQPRNVGNGTVAGLEIEARKSLDILSPSLKNFFINTNVTFAKSQISMSESELRSRRLTSREGENIAETRNMSGQAPFIINTGLSYNNLVSGLEAGVFYNVQGPTLNYIGFGNRTDTFTVPFHSLNLNLNKSFGADQRIQTGINVTNLLGEKREEIFKSYNAQDQIFSSISPGTRISLKFSYSF